MTRNSAALGLISCVLLVALALLLSCGERPVDALPQVPAQAEADRLGKLAEDDALAAAGALAQADLLDDQAEAAPTPSESAKLKADADAARMRAAIAAARAEAAKALQQEAQSRATAERAELQTLAAQAAHDAADTEAQKAMARDRRWSGIGIGGCIAAAIALLICRLPPWIAIGGPAAAAAGLLWIVGWSSVPWLAQAIGLSIAGVLLVALALLVAYIVREWRRHADDLEIMERPAADAASIARQPRLIRPFITWLLGAA